MSYEHKEGFGALFKSDKKGNEKAPDYKGTIMTGGNVYELAGWIKQGAKGSFLSLSAKVKAPEGNVQAGAPQATAPKVNVPKIDSKDPFSDFDDNLPF